MFAWRNLKLAVYIFSNRSCKDYNSIILNLKMAGRGKEGKKKKRQPKGKSKSKSQPKELNIRITNSSLPADQHPDVSTDLFQSMRDGVANIYQNYSSINQSSTSE